MAKEQRRSRLSIDVPLEAHRRIHIAAARRDQSMREYVWEAIEARLRRDLVNELASGDLTALTEQADPVLAELWNNPRDAAYDKL
jgi:predicted Holliday junction resolvase-like endonuclease